MNNILFQALTQLNLEPGQRELIHVNGHQFEIRRLEDDEPSQFEDMVMLQPWVEFPRGEGIPVPFKQGVLPLPDPPDIPPDFEEYES